MSNSKSNSSENSSKSPSASHAAPEPELGQRAWHAQSAQEVVRALATSDDGLSQDEARRRLDQYGHNKVRQQKSRPWWRRLLAQFTSVLILVLIGAGIISALLGQLIDAAAIAAVVLINAIVGFVQEGRAEKALASISNMLSPRAQVIRDGRRKTIDAQDVVPGDVVTLTGGDRVPADLRLVEATRFRTQEAPLTGESEAVDKRMEAVDESADLAERSSMAYASTLVAQGTATGVVVATGDATEIGRISAMLDEVQSLQTPLLKQLDQFGKVLAAGTVAIAAAMAVFGVLFHGYAWTEMFMAAIGLAVAAIPEGLPAVVTITLALGVQAMAKQKAIIRRLPAVETLGSVSTICSDKTGTLTRNEMTASVVALSHRDIAISGVGFAPDGHFHEDGQEDSLSPESEPGLEELLTAGLLCNDASLYQHNDEWRVDGDPTEAALVVAAAKAGMDTHALREQAERVASIPFESERKYMATLNPGSALKDAASDAEPMVFVKGAPDVLLHMCDNVYDQGQEVPLDKAQWQQKIEELSSRGLRVLAVARKAHRSEQLEPTDVEQGLLLLGLVGIIDPPREGVAAAIDKCQSAGIKVKMITGDHALTASAIADKLGLAHADRTLTGAQLDKISDEDLPECIDNTSVFARAAPEHKLRLVQAIQARGHVCAMTGDGVNDAPALKRADVGVAMGIQGTEASKEAAEMVLADDNFATIVNAVEQGRKVYDNITKTIQFLLPTNGAESLAMLVAVLWGVMLPITPVQILWVNMITAVTLGLALAFEPADAGIMKRRPRDPGVQILSGFLLWRVVFVSVLLVTAVYIMFLWLQNDGAVPVEVARSAAVNMLVAGEIMFLINSRFLFGRSLSVQGFIGSRPAIIAIALVVCFQLLWTYAPPLQFLFGSAGLQAQHWAAIWLMAGVVFLIVELEKYVWRKSGKVAREGV